MAIGGKGPMENPVIEIPEYLSDLNAMHDAEKVLQDGQWMDYSNVLIDVVPCSRRGMIHATAAQRAEAFLKTIGKWEDKE